MRLSRCICRVASALALCSALAGPSPMDAQAQQKTKPTPKLKPSTFAGTKAGQEWDGNGLKLKFRWCPPGKFTMGSPKSEKHRNNDEDQVSVTLTRGFWLGTYEVTQAQWQSVMRTRLKQQKDKPNTYGAITGEGSDHPMYFVNHDEATEFCRKLTQSERAAGRLPSGWEYRLPTEAQWEYACRAGTTTATAFGDSLSSTQANFNGGFPYNGAAKGPYKRGTAEVGTYGANRWGLHDMHGNVWEWCRDWYQSNLPGGTDPEVTKMATRRVLRGGSWFNGGGIGRAAYRGHADPNRRGNCLGFRLVAVQLGQ